MFIHSMSIKCGLGCENKAFLMLGAAFDIVSSLLASLLVKLDLLLLVFRST
jgi:hypothetical protein